MILSNDSINRFDIFCLTIQPPAVGDMLLARYEKWIVIADQ
jgi:hypothetical protein